MKLFISKKEWLIFLFLILAIFNLNLFFHYQKYDSIKSKKIIKIDGIILNCYTKKDYYILKTKTKDFIFYTSSKDNFTQYKKATFYIVTKNINFLDFLKGFYAPNITILPKNEIYLKKTINFIKSQHDNNIVSSLFLALFLAIPPPKQLRETVTDFGIAHLIAISGYHIGLISFMLFFILKIFLKPIWFRFFPYINLKFLIFYIIVCLLFIYLYILGEVASYIRALVMFLMGIYFLRRDIKILSFETLLVTVLIILSLFPTFLFSVGFYFSVLGVFYIFLFLHYFKNLNKIVLFVMLNFWIFFAFNPIIHFFFPQTSYYQLLSPIITMLFNIFYPTELFLHIFGLGDILDNIIIKLINIKIYRYDYHINIYVVMLYLILSLASIKSKIIFILLNISILIINFFIFFS